MASAKSITPSFALRVITPSIFAVTSIAMLLLYVVNGIFQETNRLDGRYTERLARSAMSSLSNNLETILLDKSDRDGAAENAGQAEVDANWIDGAWGFASAHGAYNAVFVAGPAGQILYAAQDGKRLTKAPDEVRGAEIAVLLNKANAKSAGQAPSSGFIRFGGSISAVGVARIHQSSNQPDRDAEPLNSVVFVKRIDDKVLRRLAQSYAIEQLRFTPAGESQQPGTVGILSPSGEKIGQLTWMSRNPGDQVRDKFGNIVSMMVAMFLFMIAVLLYMSWKGFREAHDSHSDAIAASLRDDLTGLANRREMFAALNRELTSARGTGGELSVIYADLDGFKEVNDSYGHEIGDMLLKASAAGFAYLAREANVIARLGGDEFAIIMTGKGCGGKARLIAQRMIDFLAEPMIFDGRIASVSVSVGIVDLENDDADVKEIIRRADVAMYAAKSQGRNCTINYQKSLDFKREENRSIANELRQHIRQRNLAVVYQPIVDARTRRIKGVEALVRWPKNATTNYTPDVFIPVAEEFGLIEDLGLFVLTEACRQAAQWPDIFISVNVSPIQFMNPAFAELVAITLTSTGLDARRLEIEVTEGFIIDNAARANAIISRLHDMHVRIALDDFGTGFSSIGHLRRFKFDKLKLDRSMVTDILRQPSALRLVQGTIAMADALGLTVVAEGIEDENQVSVLRLAGCNQFQGFLFSRPVEAGEITKLLQDAPTAMAG